jgi:glutathione S-transferase
MIMKLYYSPGACSLAVHIAAREANVPLSLEKVDLGARKTESGADYLAINPKGYVPALGLTDGSVMTEGTALLQFMADRNPDAKLAPAQGSMERYRLQEWLGFINSEIHKGFSPLWNPASPDATKAAARDRLAQRFTYLDQTLAAQPYLMGEQFTVADGYLFTVMNWTNILGIDVTGYSHLRAFMDRVGSRPKVREAMIAEGLLKQAA